MVKENALTALITDVKQPKKVFEIESTSEFKEVLAYSYELLLKKAD
jgi:hypothetical protein